jgi:hypothetical protein
MPGIRDPGAPSPTAADHLAPAARLRAEGQVDAMRASLLAAFAAARAAGDTQGMVAAGLALPTSQRFGVHPGMILALLHEAYAAADTPLARSRLAAALARSWAYGYDAVRAARFADEAQRLAAEVALPDAVADARDAALVAHWGPDDFEQRVRLAARLDEVAAHLPDPDLRLSAHLWGLTTAWECLDIVAVHRQLRALDILAEESGSARVAFFAVSRRAMYALATDDLVAADPLIARTAELGAAAGEPDVEAVLKELGAARARVARGLSALEKSAAGHEAFSAAEGIPSVSAERAELWLAAGHPDRAASLVTQLAAGGLNGIARDVDFLLTVSLLVRVAADAHMSDVARAGAEALEPYAGRGVLNAGAVAFHGVVDDYLYHARRTLGEADADRWRHAAQSMYRRIGARGFERALGDARPPVWLTLPRSVSMRRDDTGRWLVGPEGATFSLADLRGLHYLRYLLERPGVDVAALELSSVATGHPDAELDQADMGDVLDATALAAYRRRLSELDAELDSADYRGDQTAALKLSAERAALLAQLDGAIGLRGRPRRAGASAERARIAVRKAISAALTQIERHDATVARLLRNSVHVLPRAVRAICLTAAHDLPMTSASSSYGTSNTLRSTKTASSAGRASRARRASRSTKLSANSTSSATSGLVSNGSGSHSPMCSSRCRAGVRMRLSDCRVTIRTRLRRGSRTSAPAASPMSADAARSPAPRPRRRPPNRASRKRR